MAIILNIETSTEVCSVSISFDGIVSKDFLKIHFPEENAGQKLEHSKLLAKFIDEILNNNPLNVKIKPDAIAISSGPGSYTGLRIGTSLAKGYCFAANIPIIAVDTMKIIVEMAKTKINFDFDYLLPMIDARRMEVYTAIFDNEFNKTTDTFSKIIDKNSFTEFSDKKIVLSGNGIYKIKSFFDNNKYNFLDNIYPSAEYMGMLSEKSFNKSDFVDIVYFEPHYLKDFIATVPKKLI